jgi:hypothetical protein
MTAACRCNEPTVNPRGATLASWVRCICRARGSSGRGVPAALGRRSRARRRRRSSRPLEPVCLWCARGGPVPHSRRSRHTQPISGADRRCQGQPDRAERSEPRSGGLDCRRAAELPSSPDRECSFQAIARADAMRGKRGTAGQRAHALPMQAPGQERLGRADACRPRW